MTDTQIDIKALISAGKNAKLKQYADFLTRVKAGETLSLADQKVFDYLRRTLDAEHTAAQDSDAPRTLPNRLAIVTYLQSAGWQVSRGTLYNHVRAGRIPRQPDGSFLVSAVDTYAAANLKRTDGTPVTPADAALDALQRERLELELRRERAETELAELKLNNRRRDLIAGPLEQELARRLTILASDIRDFIPGAASRLIALCGGDQARAPEVVDYLLAASERWLARYAQGKEFAVDPAGRVSPSLADDLEDDIDTDDPDEAPGPDDSDDAPVSYPFPEERIHV